MPGDTTGPVNYNTQFLIRADGCILTENPLGDEEELSFRKKRNQAEDKRRFSKTSEKETVKVEGKQAVLKSKEGWEAAVKRKLEGACFLHTHRCTPLLHITMCVAPRRAQSSDATESRPTPEAPQAVY